jgi:hypothetical protein
LLDSSNIYIEEITQGGKVWVKHLTKTVFVWTLQQVPKDLHRWILQ